MGYFLSAWGLTIRHSGALPESMEQKKKSDDNLISFGALDEFGAALSPLSQTP